MDWTVFQFPTGEFTMLPAKSRLSTPQVCSIFHLVRANWAKFRSEKGNMKFKTLNEE
jgi:hypothetical protein